MPCTSCKEGGGREKAVSLEVPFHRNCWQTEQRSGGLELLQEWRYSKQWQMHVCSFKLSILLSNHHQEEAEVLGSSSWYRPVYSGPAPVQGARPWTRMTKIIRNMSNIYMLKKTATYNHVCLSWFRNLPDWGLRITLLWRVHNKSFKKVINPLQTDEISITKKEARNTVAWEKNRITKFAHLSLKLDICLHLWQQQVYTLSCQFIRHTSLKLIQANTTELQ